jgi:hypothetical protein
MVIHGRTFYLGRFGSVESRAEYNRIISEWLAQGPGAPAPAQQATAAGSDLRISELILAYLRHAEGYYVKNGEPRSEVGMIKLAARPLRHLYGDTAAKDFGPLALKTVRQNFIKANLCRNEVNRRTRLIVRMFKWAAETEMVPPRCITGSRRSRDSGRAGPRPANPRRSSRSRMRS